jgi:transposase
LPKLNLKTVKALTIRESFQKIYESQTELKRNLSLLLQKWYFWATHSRLEPIIKVAKTIKNHWDGIIEWKRSQINNGILVVQVHLLNSNWGRSAYRQ